MRKACHTCGRPSDRAYCDQHRKPRRTAAVVADTGRPYRGTAKFRRMRSQVWERDHGRCGRCGRRVMPGEDWDLGHLIPHAQGGPFELENLRVEHVRCNRGGNG